MPADSSVRVVALEGIPEVGAGDDLGRLLGDAIDRTPGALPLTDADVLVVTQKVVSKAEGAIVDLTGVVAGEQATDFAQRFDRDPRQLQVVLDQAVRVVRMDHGVLITETPQGFVCANGGVDASNVGPGTGSIVTLLPADADASAAAIRAAIRERFGQDVPVVVSDSFGRPWRGASSTWRSASLGCCRSRTCAAAPMPTAGSCMRPCGPSPTSSRPPPSSPSARPPAVPPRSSGERRSRVARAPSARS